MKKKFSTKMKFNEAVFLFLTWIIPFSLFGCDGDSGKTASQLHHVATFKLSFGEPSGITYSEAENVFWIVSGSDQKIYKTDTTGTILQTLAYNGDDLEGITLDRSTHLLWIVEEKKRELLQLDINGNVLQTSSLPLPGPMNSGLEGVAQDELGTLFLLNEKEPGKFIELNQELAIKSQREISFAADFSDMVYSQKEDCFYILSDESSALYKWSKDKGVLQKFDLPMQKFEGIAINSAADKFFLVNDKTNELWIYSLR